jgi:glutamate formiminotransferase
MAECVALARTVGAAVAARFGVPVFLYEEAAVDPARRRLETIRQGGLEGLADRMTQPGWAPDFGPSTPHPTAGVSVVGARKPLVAYNINLATDRLDVAKRIASVVRERGGGLPCVKALGLTLHERGLVQVSMNLTDYERTSLSSVFEAVRREAAHDGVSILESEIVGLVPAAALTGVTPAELRLRNFTDAQILEKRLADAFNLEF